MKGPITVLLLLAFVNFCYGREESEDPRLLNTVHTTMTVLALATTTTTVPASCQLMAGTITPCKNRRRRMALASPYDKGDKSGLTLDGSLEQPERVGDDVHLTAAGGEPSPRLDFTHFFTVTSTYTFTSTATDPSTTFSLLYLCSAPGASFPNECYSQVYLSIMNTF